jgi:hypothetical protein
MSPSAYIVRLWRQGDQETLAGQVEASDGALSAGFASPTELAAILHAPSILLRPRTIPLAPQADVIKLYRDAAARR